MLIDDVRRSSPSSTGRAGVSRETLRRPAIRRALIAAAVGAALVALAVGERMAFHIGALGPLTSLYRDFAGAPKSATVPWAGFLLALVGVPTRVRLFALGAAVATDAAFVALRTAEGRPFTVGNGPTIALTVLAVVAAVRWTGPRRNTALRAVALGALMILATKVGDIWLDVTAWATPHVLDPYAELADHALGAPSWLAGRALDAGGPVPLAILRWVYFELPVAAIVVAVWQLRGVVGGEWPRHYLVRTFLTLGLIGPVLYVVFPVVGPMLAYGGLGHGMQLADVWPRVTPPHLGAVASMPFDAVTPRNCMPSMHTAWATSLFIHSRIGPRWLRWGGAFWLVGTLCATLGFGAHYGVDLVAGAALCLTVESMLREPDRGWDRARATVVALGAALFTGVLLCTRFLAPSMARHPAPFGIAVLGTLAALVALFYRTWFARPEN